VIGVIRRRRFIAGFVLASIVVGLAAALLLGGPVYKAQSVLLYHPDTEGRGNDPALTVQTQANMVLLDTNLEETRRRLDMPVSLKQLESACEVKTTPNTALIMIDVMWKSPEIAAKVANTLRDVFVSNQQDVRERTANQEVADLRARTGELRDRIKTVNTQLDGFTASSGLVDLDKETQNYLVELTSAEALFDQARAEKQSLEMQIQSVQKTLARMPKESAPQGSVKDQPLNELNTRATRLLNAIHEDQTVRANQAELEGARIDFERAKQLYAEGLAPKSSLDKAEAAYNTQKQRAVDTGQVSAWRDEMSRLDQGILPDSDGDEARQAKQKLFQLQLDAIAAEQKVKQYGESVDRLRKKIEGLPKLQRDYLMLSRDADSNQAELKMLEDKLGRAEREQKSKLKEFVMVADATAPALPVQSRRTIIFLGICAFGTMLALGVVLTAEVLNRTVRSAGEAGVKVPLTLLGVVPRLSGYKGLPEPTERVPEPFRALALHVRRTVPKSGARILFISARPGEGVTTVVDYLAESLRREQLTVLVRGSRPGGTKAERASAVLAGDSESNDIVLLDGPPILESVDAEVLAPLCDAAILVISSGVTPVSDITEAITRVRSTRVPIAGAVLNRVDPAYL